jgi:membrane protein required for colicin V production
LLYGLKRGLVLELSGLLSLIIGYCLAISQMHRLVAFLSGFIHVRSSFLTIISFLLIFIIVYTLVMLAGKLISRLMHVVFLGWLDHIGGVVMGLGKGILWTSILLYLLAVLPIKSSFMRTCDEALLVPYIRPVAPAVFNALKGCCPGAGDFYESFKKSLTGAQAEGWEVERFLHFLKAKEKVIEINDKSDILNPKSETNSKAQ